VLRILSSPLDGGPLLSLSLKVEHLKVLRVEHLKVQLTYWVGGRWSSDGGLISRAFVPHPAGGILSLSVEPAYASLTVEHLKVLKVEHLKVLMVEHLKVRVYLLVWGVNSRACLRILSSPLPLLSLRVEHLKVRVYLLGWGVNSRACLRILNSRAPKGP